MSCDCNSGSCKGGSAVVDFMVGAMVGMVAGVAVGMAMCPSRREMKKMAHNAAKNVNDLVTHLTDSMGCGC